MRYLLQLAVVALAITGTMASAVVARSADVDSRSAIAGRKTMRAELADALVDGHISRADHTRLMEEAQRLLSDDDFRAFAPTLDRLVESAKPVSHPRRRASEGRLVDAESDVRDTAAAGDPALTTKPKRSAPTSPFIEEISPGTIAPREVHVPYESDGMTSEHSSPDCNDGGDCTEGDDCCDPCCGPVCRSDYFNIDVTSGVDAFKGPVDFGNANGNFGLYTGANAGLPIMPQLGLGMQAGINGVFSDLKGIPYSVPNGQVRSQLFTTVGLFDRFDTAHGRFGFGVVYDYSFDEYYSFLQMSQWRGKMSYEFNPWNEIGVSASVAEHGATAQLTALGAFFLDFKPMDQGYVFWTHKFMNEASISGRLGVAERPGEFVFGATGKAPLTQSLSMVGDFSYIMPNAPGGPTGQTQETWNLSIGMEFKFGGPHDCMGSRYAAFIPVADNGSFAVRQLQ